MPKHLQKSLQDYLSKIRKHTQHNIQHSSSFPPSKEWILSGCKQPKTLSFAIARGQNNNIDDDNNNNNNDAAATLSDIDRFLFENFRSLYLKDDNEDNNNNNSKKTGFEDQDDHQASFSPSPRGVLFGSPRFVEPPPDLCGSHRFFVSPGSSGSLIEEARNSLTATSEDLGSTSTSTTTLNDHSSTISNDSNDVKLPEECIAVLKYSPSPYDDFRRSMQEMVEARVQHNAKVDWDFMEELLFCYLNLNEKKSYKFILSAFVDLIVVLRENSNKVPARSRNFRVARERRRRVRNVT